MLSYHSSLRRLSIARPKADKSIINIIPCLEVIPSLTTLILDLGKEWPQENTLKRLTVTDSAMAGGLLPALKNLRIVDMILDGPLLAATVRSHIAIENPGMAQLRTLTLSIGTDLLHFDHESMGNLCVDLRHGFRRSVALWRMEHYNY